MLLSNKYSTAGDCSFVVPALKFIDVFDCSPHPYLFFNADGSTFTFMGFIIDVRTGNILLPNSTEVLTEAALSRQLCDALIRNRVDLQENFDALPRCDVHSRSTCFVIY